MENEFKFNYAVFVCAVLLYMYKFILVRNVQLSIP